MIEILNRYSKAVIYRADMSDVKSAVIQAVKEGVSLENANLRSANLRSANLRSADLRSADLTSADLTSANLRSADLTSADLTSADLRYANLTYANLTYANLTSADLTYADLRSADLTSADLTSANLTSADLTSADLRYANLTYANLTYANLTSAALTYANLTYANLTYADLTAIRDDLFAVLSATPFEVPALRSSLIEGRVDGSQYRGECACLVGTLANAKQCQYDAIPGLTPDSERPAERFFMNIKAGDTPSTNQCSKLAVEWIDQWLVNIRTLIGK